MNRYATFLAVVTLAFGFAAVRTADQPQSPEPVGLQEALSDDQRVQELVVQYRAFKETFQTAVDTLRSGQIQLKEAVATVRDASNRFHPKYLKMLSHSDKGATPEARIARNLIGHIETAEHFHPTKPSPLPRLAKELRAWLDEIGE